VVSFTPRPLYLRGKCPGTHWIGGRVVLREEEEEEKNKKKKKNKSGLSLNPDDPSSSPKLIRINESFQSPPC
jgi:hypothetical protein